MFSLFRRTALFRVFETARSGVGRARSALPGALLLSPRQALKDLQTVRSWYQSGGIKGGIYLPELQYLQQDTGGIPVTAAGQPVGRWLDCSEQGNHAAQATTADKPISATTSQTARRWLNADITDVLPVTFPSALGSVCTIARAGAAGIVFSEGQTIGTTWNGLVSPYQFNSATIVANRAFTAYEKAVVQRVLSRYADSVTNATIMYTAMNHESHMVRIPRFNLSFIDPSWPDTPHPAFIVGGVTKEAIYIGKYPGEVVNGELVSVPGVDPSVSLGHDQFVTAARACGQGWHVMTNAEWAAIMLWCWKTGYQPTGNNNYGRDYAQTSQVGVRQDGLTPGTLSGSARTLTGSGPIAWNHNNDASGITDLNGNVWEWAPGVRLNAGEIQVIENNDASSADLSSASAAWKAIYGATGALVAPGSAGTVKYAGSGTAGYTLVRASGQTFEGMTNPGANPVGAAALQRLKALGLYPIASSGLGNDLFYVTPTGERITVRGGGWNHASGSGVAALNLSYVRASATSGLGGRPAYVR